LALRAWQLKAHKRLQSAFRDDRIEFLAEEGEAGHRNKLKRILQSEQAEAYFTVGKPFAYRVAEN
jgi:hypothetical protein